MGLPVPTINTNAYKIKIRQKLTTYKPQIHKPMTYSINNSKNLPIISYKFSNAINNFMLDLSD
ncbi:hypothetical protein C1H46_045824 [Malus baccata]|uniref:Uncharacterized protein n=1 Tax=Malus baccata TaxID=106549 RepID=A0A540K300_MALBA|nr:hypothetical protein C1H46_045824 [Malus baccata]